jgi:leucyl aminopeptidase (aminopeptidase T)
MLNRKISSDLAKAGRALIKDVMLAKPGEHVLITADSATDPEAVQALWDAAREIDDKVAVMVSPQAPFQGGFADPYISDPLKAAMTNADVWVELAFPYLAGSHAFDAAMRNNRTRYYLATGMTSDAMVRLFNSVDLDDLFALQRAFDEVLASADGKECRITNPLGTDVTFQLDSSHSPFGMCRAETPGLTGVLGTVFVMPKLETVRGTIVVENICTDNTYIPLPEPVALKVDGKVQQIGGGGAKRDLVEKALRKGGGGKDYGYVVHFTCGVHSGTRYTGECFVEDQRVPGYNAVGLGLPFWVEGGGETHPDTVLSSQSIWIDGQQIVKDGAIVGPDRLIKLAGKVAAAA